MPPLCLALLALGATGPAARDRALTPPLGWRHWNQWNGNINQAIVEGIIDAIAKQRRDDGISLAQVGYTDVGIDDGWQKCGSYGPFGYRYHTAAGDPVVDTHKFPNLTRITEKAHSHNLTAGWYGNACGCVDGCCSDHCDSLECFAGDVNATLALGFDSYKIDGCGAQRDIELWARAFNHSIVAAKKPLGMMIENCHDGDGDSPGANEPHYENGNLWCPFHTYRTSGDARPTYGSLLHNLNSTRRLALANLSVPGCWAFADMMEIGVTATQHMHDCGETGTEACVPLNVTEARSHFGAWAIVSSPLVLSFDLRDETVLHLHWPTITNPHAIEVNQDYAGFSGTLFAESTVLVNFTACDWKAGVTCEWPSWTSWYKPLSGRDDRGSTMAVLLMNNAPHDAQLSFDWAAVPGLGSSVSACTVFDVWQRRSLGRFSGPTYTTTHAIAPRDSHFVTLSACGAGGHVGLA